MESPRAGLVALWSSVLLAAVSSMAGGCPSDPRAGGSGQPVAFVGKVPIREADFLATLSQRGVARVADPAARRGLAENLLEQQIEEELIRQAAEEAGVTVDSDTVDREVRSRAEGYPPGTFARVLTAEQLTIRAFKEGVRRRLVQDAFLRQRLAQLPAVTEAEIQARYEATYAQQRRPEEVRARQILLRTSEEAKHVLEEIRTRKTSFEAAAQKYSTGAEAEQGGDLGFFAKGDLPDVFDTCHALDNGAVSDVVPSDYGFHIFQVIDRRTERVEPLEGVRDAIAESITRERQTAAVEALLAELRSKTPVKVRKAALDRVVTLLPPPPVKTEIAIEEGMGQALDSHVAGSDPLPAVPKE